MSDSKSIEWKKAMEAEMTTLEENNTWTLVDRPLDKDVIDCRWVFKRKQDEYGAWTVYKARLVARGFQQKNVDSDSIYSPVAKLVTLRTFVAICLYCEFEIYQMDVCSAFLNGDIKQEVYIRLPKGFETEKTGKLNKSLYGFNRFAKRLEFEV